MAHLDSLMAARAEERKAHDKERIRNGRQSRVRVPRELLFETSMLCKKVIAICCPHCRSYLQPPLTWVKSGLDPEQLLMLAVENIENISDHKIELATAEFNMNPERCEVIAIKEAQHDQVNCTTQFKSVAELVIDSQSCISCSSMLQDVEGIIPDDFQVKMELRYTASQKELLWNLLESLYARDAIIYSAICVRHFDCQIDLYFKTLSAFSGFETFLMWKLPLSKTSMDNPSSCEPDGSINTEDIYSGKIKFVIEICPVHPDDLIIFPPLRFRALGSHALFYLGPLAVCAGFALDKVLLLDPISFKEFQLFGPHYPAAAEILFASSQLIEFRVLSLHPTGSRVVQDSGADYCLAEATVVRVLNTAGNSADHHKNEEDIVTVTTHLTHLLKPGDNVLGYDLRGVNHSDAFGIWGDELKNHSLPDVILIRKSDTVVVKCDHDQYLGGSGDIAKRRRISGDGHFAGEIGKSSDRCGFTPGEIGGSSSEVRAIKFLYGKRGLRPDERIHKTYWDEMGSHQLEQFLSMPV